MAKKKILIIIDWYLPAYKAGGPIRSIAALVNALHGYAEFSIVTSCYDADGSETGVRPVNEWTNSPDGVRIIYCDFHGIRKRMTQLLTNEKYDIVYLNSMFSRWFTIQPLRILQKKGMANKAILAPRGMVGAGALQIKKFRKKLFLKYASTIGLYSGISWHASTEQEAQEIRSLMGKVPVTVAMNLSMPTTRHIRREKTGGELRLVFVSRISVKKNLLDAVRYVNEIRDGKIRMDIYGPIEDQKYWQLCREEFNNAPTNVSIHYGGDIAGDEVFNVLAGAHALLLPTRHENFGHVILESLAVSCPVIISDQTPWRNLVSQNAGWDLPLESKSDFVAAVQKLLLMEQSTYDEISNGAFQLASDYLRNSQHILDNKKLFGL